MPGHPQPASTHSRQPGSAHPGDEYLGAPHPAGVLRPLGLAGRQAFEGLVNMIVKLSTGLLLASISIFCADRVPKAQDIRFRTSDRCIACHNLLTTSDGVDVSIGYQWRASMMANSARDPY